MQNVNDQSVKVSYFVNACVKKDLTCFRWGKEVTILAGTPFQFDATTMVAQIGQDCIKVSEEEFDLIYPN